MEGRTPVEYSVEVEVRWELGPERRGSESVTGIGMRVASGGVPRKDGRASSLSYGADRHLPVHDPSQAAGRLELTVIVTA
jgi:hypothetical protein